MFSCRPLAGHYEPLVPLAAAARAAGHAVAFATGDPYVDRARAAGFDLHLVKPVSLDTLTQALATTRV